MKAKFFLLMFGMIMLAWMTNGMTGSAEAREPIYELEPIIYEKLKFKKNTDYLHDGKKTEMKNTIPVKQFDIYFDGRKQFPRRGDTSYLFQSEERAKKSTVAAKTSELKLFSIEAKGEKSLPPLSIKKETTSGNTVRTMILIAIITVGIIILFTLFLPKLIQAPHVNQRKVVGR